MSTISNTMAGIRYTAAHAPQQPLTDHLNERVSKLGLGIWG
jgi:hypothetical protein